MHKCEKCGTEFDSKFCPNCGAPISEAASNAGNSAVDGVHSTKEKCDESEMEKAIITNGVVGVWKTANKPDYNMFMILRVIGFAFLAACLALLAISIYKYYEFTKVNSLEKLLRFEPYKREINTMFILIPIFGFIYIVMGVLSNYYKGLRINRWTKSLNLNVSRIIRALPIAITKEDKAKFEEVTGYLYAAYSKDYAGIVKEYLLYEILYKSIQLILYVGSLIIFYYVFTSIPSVNIEKDDVIGLFIIGISLFIFAPLLSLMIYSIIYKLVAGKQSLRLNEWVNAQIRAEANEKK